MCSYSLNKSVNENKKLILLQPNPLFSVRRSVQEGPNKQGYLLHVSVSLSRDGSAVSSVPKGTFILLLLSSSDIVSVD